jgi:signal transduction histidine kinase
MNRQREILKAVIDAQEKERHEIANELHDNVNQLLTTCKLQLEAAEYYANDKMFLPRISSFMQTIINEIRSISHQLNPANIETAGLFPSVEDMVTRINAAGKLKLEFIRENVETSERCNREIDCLPDYPGTSSEHY